MTEPSPTFARSIFAFRTTSIPRFLKLRASSAATSASSSGSIVGIVSSIVTFVPNSWKTSANSQPTAPQPTIAMVAGAFSRISTSSDERMFFLSSVSPIAGMPFTREPVQMTMAFFASCVVATPFASVTETDFLPVSVPVPRAR